MKAADSDRKVVLITGASSGVGQATARLLSQSGYRVFGTSRGPAGAETTPGVEMLRLDVRNDDSALSCVQAAIDRAGRLDVLVNNAAYELSGAVEEISLEEAKAQFETNFFGVVRMVKAVLPSMRRERQGQIVNVSSFSGLSAIPFMGIYSASKFALEGFTEALRMEVKPFNIRVSLTEAAFLKTPMADKRQTPAEPIPEYEPWRRRAFKAIRGHEQKAPGPDIVAETIRRIISSEAPRLHYLIGPQAKFTSVLLWGLPDGAYEQGKRLTFGLDKDE